MTKIIKSSKPKTVAIGSLGYGDKFLKDIDGPVFMQTTQGHVSIENGRYATEQNVGKQVIPCDRDGKSLEVEDGVTVNADFGASNVTTTIHSDAPPIAIIFDTEELEKALADELRRMYDLGAAGESGFISVYAHRFITEHIGGDHE